MSHLLSSTSTAISGLAQRLAATAALCQRCASTASTHVGRTPSAGQTRDEHPQFARRPAVPSHTSSKAGAGRQPPQARLQTARPRNRFSARLTHPASAHSRSSQDPFRAPNPLGTPRSGPPSRATRDSFNLAEHLARLCSAGKLDEAVATIRTSRTVAVNAAVYGILIGHVLRARKNKLAWKLWMEMKRSGVIPSPRTYTTYFSSIDPKSVSSADLENLRKIYAQYLSFVQSSSEPRSADETRARPPLDPEYAPSPIPRNAYLTLLAQVPRATLEDVSAVYEAGPPDGALASTRETHSTHIRSLGAAFADAKDAELPDLVQKLKAVCDQALEAHRAGQARLDARAVGAIIHAWRSVNFRKRELPDKETRLEIIDNLAELFGLPRLDSTSLQVLAEDPAKSSPAPSAKVPRPSKPIRADALALHYAFALANQFRSTCEQACIRWFNAIREGVPSVPVALLDTRICEIVLKACPDSAADVLIWQLRSPSASLRPELSTYTLAMRQSSYVPALRMLAHMTGKNDTILEVSEKRLLGLPSPGEEGSASVAHAQAEQATVASKRALKGYHTKHIEPDARCLSILLEKALETRDWRRLDRALRVALTFACTKDIGSKFGSAASAPAAAEAPSAGVPTEGEQAFVAAAEKILEKLTDNRQISEEGRQFWRDTRSAFPPMSRIIASKGTVPGKESPVPIRTARSSEISSRV